jgi:uncharacterized protein DUF1553/uncharacterized protein DUF1549/WD40 domain-containing protein/cytochrome c
LIFKRLIVFATACAWAAALQAGPRDALLLLKAECFGCHNPEKKKGDVILTSREGLLPNTNKLLAAVQPQADPHMPPKKQLSAGQIETLRTWIASGAEWYDIKEPPVELRELPANYRPSFALAMTSNKVAVSRGGTIQTYGVESNQLSLIKEFAAHPDAVQALAFSPDGEWLASGGLGKTIVWNAGWEITNQFVTALAFAPTGSVLAVADGANIELYDTVAREKHASWRAHSDTIYDVEFSRDGQKLVTAGADRLVKVWEVASQMELATLEGHSAQVLSVAFNTNATQVVSGGSDHALTVWDIATREKIITLGRHSAGITAVAWPDEGKVIFAVTDAGRILSYKNLKAHSGEQSSASGDERKLADVDEALWCLGTDGKMVVAAGQEGSIFACNTDGKQLAKFAVTNSSLVSVREVGRGVPPSRVRVTKNGSAGRLALPVIGLAVEPPEVHLSLNEPIATVLVGAQTADGTVTDVTAATRYANNFSDVFEITAALQVRAKRPGRAVLTAYYGGKRVDVPVVVATNTAPADTSFVRDVLPALSKAGCNAGACHAKPEGQNGFKLSVFSYDPKSDYAEIVTDVRGRRVFPAAPEASLLLKKPTATIPHEGGKRFEPESETYNLLVSWMRQGMPYMVTNEPVLRSIEAFPKTRRYHKDARQPLLVRARYSDGSVRDVTRLASFASSDKELAKVDDSAVLTVGSLSGEAVIVARYMGFVADSQVIVPSERALPASQFARLPRNNFIDDLAYKHFQSLGLFPSQLCSDAEFLRRAKLDAIGRLPTAEEVREFLEETSPEKRRRAITRILEDPAYADYWANKWADLLRPNPDRVGVKSVFVLDQWLRASFRANKPYDEFVREILLAEGSNHRDGPAVVYRDRREPPELTTMFSQLFLGTRLECAKCHHHPNEKWSQDDFYQFAAFFGPVKQKGAGLSPPISGGRETFFFAPKSGEVKHPVTREVMSPRPPDGKPFELPEQVDPRRVLADWLMSPDNSFFARAAVNRVWANFFGRGLVEPVDDFRISNPCVNQPLLDVLARDFAAHKYDLKRLMRTIMESRLYQLSSTPNSSNLADTKNFSRGHRRRLPAEVLLDAVDDAVGVPSAFEAMPPATRALQAWSYKIDSHFMDAFGRPNPSTDCPCERDTHMSVVQSLHLMNSKDLQAKLSNPKGRARKLAESGKSPQEIVTELYLASLSRFPTGDELELASEAFNDSRENGCEDVLWALLNSAEFVFNH